MKRLKKIGKIALRVFLIGTIALCIFELSYRYQWIDFYKSEWKFHNSEVSEKSQNSILILGDSFSADPNGWVYMLRDSLEQNAVYNASIPGVGPETYELIFKRRLKLAKPNHVIVQLYVGNDQYDYEKPVSWSKQPFLRNVFWSWSNRFRVLNFLNYRIGQSSVEDYVEVDPKLKQIFDPEKYSPRTKLYIRGDENYPSNLVLLDNGDISGITSALEYMQEIAGDECKFSVLIIPHCTQISTGYVNNYKELGAKIDEEVIGKSYWNKRLTKLGFDVIDPLEYFQEIEAGGEQLYYANDPHLNAKGNAYLTSFILQNIEE